MTLISEIITDAYRENNTIAAGKSPSSTQETEGLRLLKRVFNALIGNEAGERLRDWPLGDYGRQTLDQLQLTETEIANPPINSRLVHTAEAAITIYFPPQPSDGSRMSISDPHSRLVAFNVTLDANGRTIENTATVTLDTNGTFREWFYRADLSDWVRLSDLATTDNVPFPTEFDDMFVSMLAIRLSPRYGRKLTEETVSVLRSLRQNFVNRYVQSEDLRINGDLALGNMSVQSFDTGYDVSTDRFNRGG